MRPRREPARNNQQTYMVTSATWQRRRLFHNERWARLFIDTLYHYRDQDYALHAFVVMPDHFHALITPRGSLERAVQYIKGGFSHRVKVELGSNMEVWQKGFSDHRIRDAEDYARHVTYIHENPVRKRLSETAAGFPYSSAFPGFQVDEVPQRLKPLTLERLNGAAEAAPFQSKAERPASDQQAAPLPANEEAPLIEEQAASLEGKKEANSDGQSAAVEDKEHLAIKH